MPGVTVRTRATGFSCCDPCSVTLSNTERSVVSVTTFHVFTGVRAILRRAHANPKTTHLSSQLPMQSTHEDHGKT